MSRGGIAKGEKAYSIFPLYTLLVRQGGNQREQALLERIDAPEASDTFPANSPQSKGLATAS